MAPRKILFLTVSMKGHLVHTARLAEWFLQYPEEYEVHVGAVEDVFKYLPEGCVTHAMEDLVPPITEIFAKGFGIAGQQGKDWFDSQAKIMENLDFRIIQRSLEFAVRTVKELEPNIVVCDHSYNFGNVLHTLCRNKQIPMVMITSMGRPETMLRGFNMAIMTFRYWRLMIGKMKEMNARIKEAGDLVGKLLPESDKPLTIFPGAQVLVQQPPEKHELYVGPFVPLPGLLEATPRAAQPRLVRRSSSFSLGLQEAPELKSWLLEETSQPVIYMALGTLAKPTKELVARVVEGLDGGPWRVLWSLPKAHQDLLPRELAPGRWFIQSFVPQFALLRSGRVTAFLSHCGGNSTHEALCQGVPMICMPFFGDQYEWAESVCRYAKAGVGIDKNRSTAADIRAAAEKIISTPSFKSNAEVVAKKMASNARLRLEWLKEHWTEHQVKLEKDMKVGVPVAAAVIDAALHGQDPRKVLPPQSRTVGCNPHLC